MTPTLYAVCGLVMVAGVAGAVGLVRLMEALGWMPYDEEGNPL